MREIDLHVHTNISDGSETPAETVKYARSLGLRAIAVTDHDSINGVAEAQKAGKNAASRSSPGWSLAAAGTAERYTCSDTILISAQKSCPRCSTG